MYLWYNAIKQGKFSPGAHIPIIDHSEFENDYPDFALLFGYNHSKEIMDKEKKYINKWVPEFSTNTYPPMMVDHKMARERCLQTYKNAVNN